MADSHMTDEFNMDEPPPAATPTAHDEDRLARSSAPSGKGKGVGAKGKEGWWRDWYAIAAVAVIGVVWMFWPSSPQGGRTAAQQQSGVLDPQSAMREAAQQPDQQQPAPPTQPTEAPQPGSAAQSAQATAEARPAIASSTSQPAAAPAAVAQVGKTPTGTDSTTSSPASASSVAASTGPRAPEDAIEGRLKNNEARLNDALVGLKQTQDRLDELAKRIERSGTGAAHSKAPAKTVSASTKSAVQTERKPKEPSIVRALNGEPYVINTIGRGIAFIQAGDHLEVVTPGDRVSGVRIMVIDPAAHLITTSNGVIR